MPHTYLVTGANRGLGLEYARQLGDRGDRVIATARRPTDAAELEALPVRVEPLDVADDDSVRRLAERLAGEPIDVLINNAGTGVHGRRFGDVDLDRMQEHYEVNGVGPLRVSQALHANLVAGERRTIVNMTSKMGSVADNSSGGSYAYRASKAALNIITRSMAVDLHDEGFTCVVLHPGWVRTRMGGTSAPLEPEESVRGLLRVIDGLRIEHSGRFFDYSGAEIAW